MSRRDEQDKYLLASREVGFPVLLGGVLDIFRATNSKHKYFALLEDLESMGLLRIPVIMKEIMSRPSLQGVTKASRAVEVTATKMDTVVVYVQPNGSGANIINFDDFRAVVQKHKDPVSQRFAQSLEKWAMVKAGEKNIEQGSAPDAFGVGEL